MVKKRRAIAAAEACAIEAERSNEAHILKHIDLVRPILPLKISLEADAIEPSGGLAPGLKPGAIPCQARRAALSGSNGLSPTTVA